VLTGWSGGPATIACTQAVVANVIDAANG